MLSVVLPEIPAVDNAKCGSPRDPGGGARFPETLAVDRAKRDSPRDLVGGSC